MAKQAGTEPRRGIQSVGIGLRVLTALASQRGPGTLSAIAECADLSPSQAHRYLSSLIDAGMAKQEHRSGLYDLDSGAIRIGLAALARVDTFRMADEEFSEFAARTGRTCLLATWGDAGATIIRWFEGSPPVITSLAIGSILPMLRSATGRVFYAFADPAQIARLGESAIAAEHALVPDADAIRQKVRSDVVAIVRGDLIPGLRAMAAPVFDLQGRLVLVASALAHDRPDEKGEAQMVRQLQDACRHLTETLGGIWPEVAAAKAKRQPGKGRVTAPA